MEKKHLQLVLSLIFVHLILGFKTIKLIAMKGIEQFTDIIAMAIGMAGALMKGLKKKLKIKTILITMSVAGILSYSLLGLLEIFYHDWTPRLIIFVSFVVGSCLFLGWSRLRGLVAVCRVVCLLVGGWSVWLV